MHGDEPDFLGPATAARPPSMEEFLAARGRHLLKLAWYLTGNGPDAEDLLQGVLVKVWPHWPRIAAQAQDAYVRRALTNAAYSRGRRRRFREILTASTPDAPVGSDAFADHDLSVQVAAALAAVPPRQRAVLVLRFFDDLSVEETAAILGCSQGTVKSQSARGLEKLRPLLEEHMSPSPSSSLAGEPS